MCLTDEGRSGEEGGELIYKACGLRGFGAGRGKVWLRQAAVYICFIEKKKRVCRGRYKTVIVHQRSPTRCHRGPSAQVLLVGFHFNHTL